jgi:hypothetical protein
MLSCAATGYSFGFFMTRIFDRVMRLDVRRFFPKATRCLWMSEQRPFQAISACAKLEARHRSLPFLFHQ